MTHFPKKEYMYVDNSGLFSLQKVLKNVKLNYSWYLCHIYSK